MFFIFNVFVNNYFLFFQNIVSYPKIVLLDFFGNQRKQIHADFYNIALNITTRFTIQYPSG